MPRKSIERFEGVILSGHKEHAIEVPFDPAPLWGLSTVAIRAGRRGYAVFAKVKSVSFETFVVARARKYWLLLDERTMRAISARAGDVATVTLAPRKALTVKEPAPPLVERAVDNVGARAFERVVAAFEDMVGIELPQASRRAFGSNGIKVNGKIFALFVKGTLVLKLPKERVTALIAAGRGIPFDTGSGRRMKEWISLAGPPKEWVNLAREAYAFVHHSASSTTTGA